MTLTELIAEVYLLTNRPDLVNQTLSAVRSATLKLHQSDYYYKDIFETGIVFGTSEYLQQLDYRTVIPRWRSLKYLRKTDSTGTLGSFFTVVAPEQVLDSYALNRNDICYAAGDVIQIRSSTELQYAIVGCYRNPDVGAISYSSWIANDHPWAIIFEAATAVLLMIGKDSQARSMAQLANIQLAELRNSNILAEGY